MAGKLQALVWFSKLCSKRVASVEIIFYKGTVSSLTAPIRTMSFTGSNHQMDHQNGRSSSEHVGNGMCSNVPKRGAFIVFEGLDKSGKSSQAKLLVDRLNENGISAAFLKFPTRQGPVGEVIDKYLRGEISLTDESIHLLFSADRWEMQSKLLDLIVKGVNLIVDRYAYSGIAFSAAKGLDFNWCTHSDAGLLAPDQVLFLNVSTSVALERQGFGDERYEKIDFQSKVYQQYQRLMEHERKLGNKWMIINSDKAMEEVQEEIYREVLSVIRDSTETKVLRKLFV